MAVTLIQLRLPEDEADALRDAGAAAGRSLPAEIRHRLAAYAGGSEAPALPAAPGGDAFAQLGNALAALTAQIADEASIASDPQWSDRPTFLATVRAALCVVLDGLGADKGASKGSAIVGHGIANRMLHFLHASKPLRVEPPAFDRTIRRPLAADPFASANSKDTAP